MFTAQRSDVKFYPRDTNELNRLPEDDHMPDLENVKKWAAHGRLETREAKYAGLDGSDHGKRSGGMVTVNGLS